MRLRKIGKLVGIVASCLVVSFNSGAKSEVVEPPVYPGSIIHPVEQEKIVRVYNAYLNNSDERRIMLLNLSDMIGIKDWRMSKEEEKIIIGELAQVMLYEVRRKFGREEINEVDVTLYYQEKLKNCPPLAGDKFMRRAFDYAFNQAEYIKRR